MKNKEDHICLIMFADGSINRYLIKDINEKKVLLIWTSKAKAEAYAQTQKVPAYHVVHDFDYTMDRIGKIAQKCSCTEMVIDVTDDDTTLGLFRTISLADSSMQLI